MKPPSKKIWIALITAVVIVAAISIAAVRIIGEVRSMSDNNVVFVNESNAAIGSVGVAFTHDDGTSESGGTCNADGSLLKRGAKFWLDVQFPCVLTVYADVEGREPVVTVTVEKEPPEELQEGVWYVIARDGPEGLTLALSLNLDGEELETMRDNISENLGVDVSGGEIGYCWYPGHGWQGDGEDFVVMQFSRQAGAALAEALSGAEGWQLGEFPTMLKTDTFESVYSHESLIDWAEVSDSGWFYYRDEGGGTGGYRSWDYVAAVYDPESRTLYFFEWHQ